MHSHGGSKRQRADEDAVSLRAGRETRCRAGKGSAMALPLGASCSKKRRAGGGGVAEGDQIEAAAGDEDRISALPEDLRLRILALLPLKSAIRTGALSTRWHELWARRWPAPSSVDLHLRSGDAPKQILESLQRRGLRRLDRFSLARPRRQGPPALPRLRRCLRRRGPPHRCRKPRLEQVLHVQIPGGLLPPRAPRPPPHCSCFHRLLPLLRRVPRPRGPPPSLGHLG
ncbi:unnamed protein product [Urochloa humidicola]